MKRNRKIVSILLTLSLLVTLLLPLAAPAAAAGLSVNYVDKTVNYSDDAATGDFGNIIIKETSDFTDIFVAADPTVITFTLVDGVEFPANPAVFGNYVTGATGSIVSATSTSVTFSVYGTVGEDKVTFDFGTLDIDSDFTGDVKVDVTALDSSVTNGEYVIGTILGDKNTIAALNKKDVVVGDTDVPSGTVRITESAAASMKSGELTVSLPDGVKFDATAPIASVGGTLASLVSTGGYNAVTNPTGWTLNSDRDELIINNGASASATRGFVDITFTLDVDYDCEAGDVSFEFEGDSDNSIADADVVLAVVKDFGITVKVESVKDILAGRWAKELADVTIKQNADTSLVDQRYITMEISNGRFAYTATGDVPTDTGLTCTDVDENKIVYKVTDNSFDEYVLKKLEIGTSIAASGDVTLKFSGSAGVEGDLVVGKIVKPIEVTAENATDLTIGVQGQAVGDVIIKETAAGNIMEEGKKLNAAGAWVDDSAPQLALECIDGYSFAGRPTAEVVEGDLKLDENNLVYLSDGNGDGLYEKVYVIIDKESDTASTIKFSNIKLSVSRYTPEGSAILRVKGNSVVDPRSASTYNSSTIASAVVANVVTPAPQEGAGTGMFVIGQSFYNLNGQMKMMDVAPYIKGDRTYVPVRYLAYVCGLSDEDIAWDEATQTVTLTKGETVVTLVIGSKTLTVGDQTTAMDVAPEIFNGRTMLPARFVAEAFGGTVTWNAASNTVGVQF